MSDSPRRALDRRGPAHRVLTLGLLLAVLILIAGAMATQAVDTTAGALLAVLCVALALGYRIVAARPRLQSDSAALPQDVFGPAVRSRGEARRAFQHLASGRPHLGERLRRQAELRRHVELALSSPDEGRAIRAMAAAEQTWTRLQESLRYSASERVPLEETMAAVRVVFPTALALNAAAGALRRGGGPGSPKGTAAARRVLEAHRDAPGVNGPLIERALAAVSRGESLPRAPWVNLSTGTVGDRVAGMGARRAAEAARPEASAGGRAMPAQAESELGELIDNLERTDDPARRHAQLSRIVELTFRHRSAEDQRALFYRYAWRQVDAAPELLPVVGGQARSSFPAFQYLARVLIEDGQYPQALEVCQRALDLGLDDGTASGFRGRMARIRQRVDHR